MKYISYILLPPLLLGLLAAAVYLPKYYLSPGIGPYEKNGPHSTEPTEKEKPEVITHEGLILPYLSSLGAGDLETAEAELEKLASQISPEMMTGLRVALISARESAGKMERKEVAWLAKMQALAGEKEDALNEVNRIETLQSETEKEYLALKSAQDAELAEIRVAIAALAKSNQAATERSGELLAQLEDTIALMNRGPVDSPKPEKETTPPVAVELPVSEDSLKIPAPLSVHFEGDSIVIPENVSMYVVQMGRWLKNDPRLGIRLQGRLQAGDISAEQKTIAIARSKQIKEALLKHGATGEQINEVALDGEIPDSESDAFGCINLIFFER